MKAIAAVAISSHYSITETASAGLFVGAVVTLLSITGLLRWGGRVVPTAVVRGIQVGAGLSLVISAGTTLLMPLGWTRPGWADNWVWAGAAFLLLVGCARVPGVPFALVVTVVGVGVAGVQLRMGRQLGHGNDGGNDGITGAGSVFWHPKVYVPTPADFRKGALDAGLPQLPLTLLNSILAVTSLSASLFPPSSHLPSHSHLSSHSSGYPSHPPTPSNTAIGLSIGLTNLASCWFGAMPICHGSGGLAAQYRFGARSGASVVVLGVVKLALGLFAGEAVVPVLERFPKALLGVMVLAAGVELARVGQSLGVGQSQGGGGGDRGGGRGEAGERERDVWEAARREGTGTGADGDAEGQPDLDRETRGKTPQQAPDDKALQDQWMVMLVTVAGCLAFKNDAVGFIAGMVWHWGLRLEVNVNSNSGLRGCLSWPWIRRRRADGVDADGERQSLLGR